MSIEIGLNSQGEELYDLLHGKKKGLDVNALYEKAVDYYEKQLMTNGSGSIKEFILANRWPDTLLSKFRLGYADCSSNSFCQSMKKMGFEDDCLIDSGLVQRGENGELMDTFQDALIIPIISDENVIQGLGARFMGLHSPRYMNVFNKMIPKDERFMIFGLNASIEKEQNNFIICEGYLDVIAMHNIGLTQTIAFLPGGNLINLTAIIMKYTKNVFLAFDTDDYGKNAAETVRKNMERSGINVWEINLKQYRDPYEYIIERRHELGELKYEKREYFC